MGTIGTIIAAIGTIIALVFGIIILVKAFKTSVLWGLGYIFVPFVSLIFVIKHWDETKKPFAFAMLGVVVQIIGTVIGAAGSGAV